MILNILWFLLEFVLAVAFLYLLYFRIYGNFHKVDKNLYRSAQLFCFNLFYLKMFKIKSILNLRSTIKFQNVKWYKDEINMAKKLGIEMHEYPIGDREEISVESMQDIIEIMRNAPKPMLIHCKSGADRTSLGSALYQYAINNNEEMAHKSLSIKYGHFPWFGSRTIAMDTSVDKYIKFKPVK